MRLLLTIPHYFNPNGGGRYGSTQPNPQPRLTALTQSLRSLYTLYAAPQEYWYRKGERLQAYPANQSTNLAIDIVICTTPNEHLLDQLVLPPGLFEHRTFEGDPMHLGFECHAVLQEQLDKYDLFGYMEDDLILHDPRFFTKLRQLWQILGEEVVVQPNRYERYATMEQLKKVYIDFEFQPQVDRSPEQLENIVIQELGDEIELQPTTNAHAGCFFLSQAQLAHWAAQSYFGTREASYVGPLESAATLGLVRTFKVYKPAPQNANFLEIEHFGQLWSRQLSAVRIGGKRGEA